MSAPHRNHRDRIRRAGDIARSSVKRYPREILDSLRSRQHGHGLERAGSFIPEGFVAPLAASWLGHATVLLHVGGKWILTDPVFSSRIGVRFGPLVVGVKRLEPAPVHPEDLPVLDAILISHAHFDHLDKPSLQSLVRPSTVVVTASNTGRLIPRGFADVQELAWGRDIDLGGARIRAIQPQHWGARTAWDRHRGFNSYLIESTGTRTLFAGDTAKTDAYNCLASEGGVDLGIFGIGAYDPWIEAHASPEQVWAMHEASGGRYLLPIHHRTFKLSNEAADEPLERLRQAASPDTSRVIGQDLGTLWIPG